MLQGNFACTSYPKCINPYNSDPDRLHSVGVLPLALVVVVAEVEGSEMERLERSNIAFFTGLSLISSPDIYIEYK